MPGSTTWTTPITWGTADPTVSQFNQQIRDNENHLYERAPVYVVYKSADESLNTNTSPQNDDALLWAVAANEVWSFRLWLYATDVSNGAADIKIGWSVPASTTMAWTASNLTGAYGGGFQTGITTNPNNVVFTEATAATSWGLTSGNHLMRFDGIIFVSSTAGTVNFQWAQAASNGSNVTVKKGSHLTLFKLA